MYFNLQALYLSGTYCHKSGTRPPSCQTPRQSTIYNNKKLLQFAFSSLNVTGLLGRPSRVQCSKLLHGFLWALTKAPPNPRIWQMLA